MGRRRSFGTRPLCEKRLSGVTRRQQAIVARHGPQRGAEVVEPPTLYAALAG